MFLYSLHTWYGQLLQLVPLVLIGWLLWRRGTPFQRIAPVLLDVNVALGLLLYLVGNVKVSLWHPILMFVAIGIGHAVARHPNRNVVVGAWVGVFVIVAVSVQIAAGRIPL